MYVESFSHQHKTSSPTRTAQNKSAKYFLKKYQVTVTKITEIQIFSKAIRASWIGLQIWKGQLKPYNIFKNGTPMETLNVKLQIFQVWRVKFS